VSCIAERRAIETIESGAPKTAFMQFGHSIRIEMLDGAGHSVFGAIDQRVVAAGQAASEAASEAAAEPEAALLETTANATTEDTSTDPIAAPAQP
jgi:fumarylacetoacetate (FAA) hydrolase